LVIGVVEAADLVLSHVLQLLKFLFIVESYSVSFSHGRLPHSRHLFKMLLLDVDFVLCHFIYMRLVLLYICLRLFKIVLQPFDFIYVLLNIIERTHMSLVKILVIGCQLVISL
jgi:hypothetical protein